MLIDIDRKLIILQEYMHIADDRRDFNGLLLSKKLFTIWICAKLYSETLP